VLSVVVRLIELMPTVWILGINVDRYGLTGSWINLEAASAVFRDVGNWGS
jgi:hypothetical protein